MGRVRVRGGMTLTELLVVMGGIAVLMALLFPALAGFRRSAFMANSMSNLRQVAVWMRVYSGDNREFIVPSQFNYNYSGAQYRGKVRAPIDPDGNPVSPQQGERHKGTWADILWTINEIGVLPGLVEKAGHNYQFDSPDDTVYREMGTYGGNVLRSVASNSRDFDLPGDGVAKPYGDGAHEAGRPGFFAANNFFNADPDSGPFAPGSQQGFWTTGQIKAPDRSMYLVDSFAGEVIEARAEPYQRVVVAPGGPETLEVDFRYSGVCLMLFLDGHVGPEGMWKDLQELQTKRQVRITNLTSN